MKKREMRLDGLGWPRPGTIIKLHGFTNQENDGLYVVTKSDPVVVEQASLWQRFRWWCRSKLSKLRSRFNS